MICGNIRGQHGRSGHDTRRQAFAACQWLIDENDAPPLAAHVITSRTWYTHHGIYVGDGQVVHYAGLSRGWRRGPVEQTSLQQFARGRPVSVRIHLEPRFDAEEIVARARSRIGEGRYRILSNNCEHLCEWCVCGESRSPQVESLRTRLLSAALAALRLFASIKRAASLGLEFRDCATPNRDSSATPRSL